MFGKLFNKSASKKEDRLLPYFVESNNIADETWITSQLFRGIKLRHKSLRLYYAARRRADNTWEIESYSYSIKRKSDLRTRYVDTAHSFESAVSKLMQLEKLPARGYEPTATEGNYRKVVHFSSLAYFDEQDNLVSAKNGVSPIRDTLITRKKLDKIYQKPEGENTAAPADLSTWESFYSEIVDSVPLSSSMVMPEWMLKGIKNFEKKMRQVKSTPSEASYVLSNIAPLPVEEAKSSEEAALVYQYNVMALAMLIRAGSEAYDKFSSTLSTDPATIRLLSDFGSSISYFAQTGFGLSAEQGKQLGNIIMLGRDPNADKPLPLEALIQAAQEPAAPKPPKPYSP